MTGTDRADPAAPTNREPASPDECLRLVASFRAIASSEVRARIVALVLDEAQRSAVLRPAGLG